MSIFNVFNQYFLGNGARGPQHPLTEAIQKAETPEERVKLQENVAAQAISQLKGKLPSNFTHFRNMHDPLSFELNDEERSSTHESLEFWRNLFTCWQQGFGRFIRFDLTDAQVGKVCSTLKELQEFEDILQNPEKEPASKVGEKIHAKIVTSLKERKEVRFLKGYAPGPCNDGHAISTVLNLNKDKVVQHYLNKGEGSELHAELDYDECGVFISFRSFPIYFDWENFKGELGLKEIIADVEIASKPPQVNDNPYTAMDIYGISMLWGQTKMSFEKKVDLYKGKSQLSETCAEKAIKLTVNDSLVEMESSFLNNKKIFLTARLCSMIAVYNQYQGQLTSKQWKQFENCVRGFAVYVDKLEKHSETLLEPHEQLLCESIITLLLDSKEKMMAPRVLAPTIEVIENAQLTNLDHVHTKFPKLHRSINLFSNVSMPLADVSAIKSLPSQKFLHKITPNFSIPLLKQVQEWEDFAIELHRQKDETRLLNYVSDVIFSLPIPNSAPENIWNTIPLQDSPAIIRSLKNLVCYVSEIPQNKINQFNVVYTVYCIVDALARRNPETKLQGFYFQYWPEPNDKDHYHKVSISNGMQAKRYSEIKAYAEATKKPYDSPLFYFSNYIEMERVVHDQKSNIFLEKLTEGALIHLKYLNQFYDAAIEKGLYPHNLEVAYQLLWQDDECKYFPYEVHVLRQLSFLAQSVQYDFKKDTLKLIEIRGKEAHDPLFSIADRTRSLKINLMDRDSLIGYAPIEPQFSHTRSFPPSLIIRETYHTPGAFSLFMHSDPMNVNNGYWTEKFLKSQLTLNEIECKSANPPPAPTYERSFPKTLEYLTLRAIANSPLQISTTLFWLNTEIRTIKDWHGSFDLISYLFFANGILQKTLKESPQIAHDLRQFINAALNHYRYEKSSLSTLLFIIRLGLYIETHIQEAQQSHYTFNIDSFYPSLDVCDELAHKEFEEKISKVNNKYTLEKPSKKEDETLLLRAFTFNLRPSLTFERAIEREILAFEFVKRGFPESLDESIKGLYYDSIKGLYKHDEQAYILFTNPLYAQKICDRVFSRLRPGHTFIESEWKGAYPLFQRDEINLDFSIYTFSKVNSSPFARFPLTHITSIDEQFLHLDGNWLSFTDWLSFDTKIWYHFEDKRHTDEKAVRLVYQLRQTPIGDGYYLQFELFNSEYPDINTFLNSIGIAFPKYKHWLWKDAYFQSNSQKPKKHIYVTDYDATTYRFLININDDNCEIFRTDPDGKPQAVKLIPVEDFKSTHPDLFEKIDIGVPLQIFYDLDKKRIASLNYVGIGLEFEGREIEGSYVLESKKFRDYRLDFDKDIEYLKPFKNYLKLKGPNDIKIIIPQLVPKADRIGNVYFNTDHSESRIFVNSLSNANAKLECYNPLAAAQLIMLFAILGKYSEAKSYLPYGRNFEFFKNGEMSSFYRYYGNFKDSSPNALAFYIHFALHILDNYNQPIFGSDSNLKENEQHLLEDLKRWAGEKYKRYLRMIGSSDKNRVSSDLRVKEVDERRFINMLSATFNKSLIEMTRDQFNEKPVVLLWSNDLENRYRLLNSSSGSISVYQHPTLYCKYPIDVAKSNLFGEGKSLKFISFEREHFTPQASKQHLKDCESGFSRNSRIPIHFWFIHFYEKALQSDPSKNLPLDIDLYLLSRQKEARYDVSPWIQLLYYVRRNPKKFQDLHFPSSFKSEEKFKEILYKIVNIASGYVSTADKTLAGFYNLATSGSLFSRFNRSTLTLPVSPPLQPLKWEFSQDQITSVIVEMKNPFSIIREKYFEMKLMPPNYVRANTSFALERFKKTFTSKYEKQLIEKIEKGHQENLSKLVPDYTLRNGITIKELSIEIDSLLTSEKETVASLHAEIIKLANQRPRDNVGKIAIKELLKDSKFNVRLRGKQTAPIDVLEPLAEAILMMDFTLLQKYNPVLSSNQISRVIVLTVKYYIHACRVNQLQEAKNKVASQNPTKSAVVECAKLLDWEANYNPFDMPELLIYSFRAKIQLRSNQVELFKWLRTCPINSKDYNYGMFEFEANGGKTEIVKTIRKIVKKRQGYYPLSLSSSELYHSDRYKLRNGLLKGFGQVLHAMEASIYTPLTPEHLKSLLAHIEKSDKELLHSIITPEILYAIYLKHQIALYTRNTEAVQYLGKMRKILKNKGFIDVDECRITVSPTIYAKLGIGKAEPRPQNERTICLNLNRALIGAIKHPIHLEDKRPLADAVKLTNNQQDGLPDTDLKEIKKALAEFIVKDPHLKIPAQHQNELVQYWLNPYRPMPAFLETQFKQDPETGKINIRLQDYFSSILPVMLSKGYGYDYGPSKNEKIDIMVPWIQGSPTITFFEEPLIALSATIQGHLQMGLSKNDLNTIICDLKTSFETEKALGVLTEETHSFNLWKSWCTDYPEIPSFDKVDIAKVDEYLKYLKHSNEAILWNLEKYVLEKVVFTPEQLEANACHLMHSFKKAMLFSAYTGPSALYPFTPGTMDSTVLREDNAFKAAVVQQLCNENNRTMVRLHSSKLKAILQEGLNAEPEKFKRLSAIADPKGLLRDTPSTETFARTFLEFSSENHLGYTGVVYFVGSADTQDEAMLLMRGVDQQPVQIHDRSSIENAFKNELQLDWKKEKLMVYYDPPRTIGTHVDHAPGTGMWVLAANRLPFGRLAQTALRMRPFLLGDNFIMSGIHDSLASDIEKEFKTPFTQELFIAWTMRNESAETGPEILSRIYMQIEYYVQSISEQEIIDAADDPESQIDIFHRHFKGNVKSRNIFNFELASKPLQDVGVNECLMEYYRSIYKAFGYHTNPEKACIFPLIEELINEAKNYFDKIPSKPTHDLLKTSSIYTIQHKQVETMEKTMVHGHLQAREDTSLPQSCHIYSSSLLNDLIRNMAGSAQQIFKSDSLASNLYYTPGAIDTASSGLMLLKEKFLKPVCYLLAIQNNKGKLHFFAVTDNEAAHFYQQLTQGEEWLKKNSTSYFRMVPEHKVALITTQNKLIQNGPGSMALEVEKLVSSKEYQDPITDAALLNGQIIFFERLVDRLQNWKDIMPLWDRIKQHMPAQNLSERQALENIIYRATISKYS